MNITVIGATGFLGQELCLALLKEGHRLSLVGRSTAKEFRSKVSLPCSYHQWARPEKEHPPLAALEGCDILIHLSGENIGSGRWTQKKKDSIYNSRVLSSKQIVSALTSLRLLPKHILCASAVGIYGDQGSTPLDESAATGNDFLAKVCKDWEQAWSSLESQTQISYLRTGVVWDAGQGFLAEMESIYSKLAGGVVGSGQQYIPWVHIQDYVQALLHIIKHKTTGPVNIVAPEPIPQKEFNKLFSQAMKIPAILPAPSLLVKLALGEMSHLALASHRALPKKLQSENFNFKFSTAKQALESCYKWKDSAFSMKFNQLQWVENDLPEVFHFHCDEKNLERLTPPFLKFKVLNKSTDQLQKGTVITYRLSLHGIPFKWKSEITDWKKDHSFRDSQNKGPYKKWDHSHHFVSLSGGTLLLDEVIYELPLGPLGLLAKSFVKKDIRTIFSYRKSSYEKALSGNKEDLLDSQKQRAL